MASYPSSVKSFTTKNNGAGNTIDASHINDLQAEVTAIETDLIAGLPVARGGTGLTAIGAANTIPQSNGSVLAYTASPTLTAVTAATVTSTGQVVISGAGAGQIVFPAAQNASADAKTLDDYEEGSWTPVVGGNGGTSGQTYTSQVGRYVKFGKMVIASFRITFSAKGTITGNAEVQGLPFTVENISGLAAVAALRWDSLASNFVSIVALPRSNSTAADIQGATAAAASNSVALTTTDLDDNSELAGTLIFRASA